MSRLSRTLSRAWSHRPIITTAAHQREAISAERRQGATATAGIVEDTLRLLTGRIRSRDADYDWYAYADGIRDAQVSRQAMPPPPGKPALRLVRSA